MKVHNTNKVACAINFCMERQYIVIILQRINSERIFSFSYNVTFQACADRITDKIIILSQSLLNIRFLNP